MASYSGYNYQNTSALNFSLTASGGFGSMAVSAGGSSTTSVIGSGVSAVTTSSTTISYSVNLQYIGWQVINPSDSYTVNTSAVTVLATAANQGWSWVVSQASAAWQGLTDVAWTTVQTVWSGLQQTYTWMVSAGHWVWGVATTVVTFVGDTATMVANGATFGMIPSLSAKANELRQYYGETYFWICNITGGAVTVVAAVGLTTYTMGVGTAAALQIVAKGAAIGVTGDAVRQVLQMVDRSKPWGQFDYVELGQAAAMGAIFAPATPYICYVAPVLGAFSVNNGINELAKGHIATGLFDIAVGIYASFGQCFAAGTPLLTPDGDKPIEEFKIGDLILTAPENDPDAPLEVKRVVQRFVHEATIWELRVQGRLIRTTSEHPFFVEGQGWTAASKLQMGVTRLPLP